MGEVNRGSTEYVRCVQSSLNQLLGTRLAVDGIIGPQTQSAIRSFQQQQRLVADGIVGKKDRGGTYCCGGTSAIDSLGASWTESSAWTPSLSGWFFGATNTQRHSWLSEEAGAYGNW